MFWKRIRQPKDRFDQMFSYFKFLVSVTSAAIVLIVGAGTWYLGSNMNQVRDNAEKTAIAESQKAVEKAFRTENIQEMINKAAEKEIRGAIQVEIAKQIDNIRPTQTDMLTMNRASDAISRIRMGQRSGVEDIQKIMNNAKLDPFVRNSVSQYYNDVVKNYERLSDTSMASIAAYLNVESLKGDALRKSLVDIILTSDDLNAVNSAFVALRKETGAKLPTFDFDTVKRWADKNLKNNPK